MSSAFRFRASRGVTAKEVALLRPICGHSIAEIQRRAVAQESLLDVPVLTGDWPAGKGKLIAILRDIESGVLPLSVSSVDVLEDGRELDELLSVAEAFQRLQQLRELSLEQDMLSQLEAGHISSREEYVPAPDDEA